MQKNNNKNTPNFKRGFLNIFSTQQPQPKKYLRNTEHLNKILELQKEIQELKYQNHFLKKGKKIIAQEHTPTPTPKNDNPFSLNQQEEPTEPKTLSTLDYLYLLDTF